jgi:hypothetical protein
MRGVEVGKERNSGERREGEDVVAVYRLLVSL